MAIANCVPDAHTALQSLPDPAHLFKIENTFILESSKTVGWKSSKPHWNTPLLRLNAGCNFIGIKEET
jgi:hypothetical protein